MSSRQLSLAACVVQTNGGTSEAPTSTAIAAAHGPIPQNKPQLRPYQQAGLDELRACVRAGKKRILLVCPTGGGKTVLASSIIESAVSRGGRVLFIAHRIELLNQTARQLGRFGLTDGGIVRASDPRVNPDAAVQIASIQTLNRREDDNEYTLVFVDEAHLSMADSYRSVLARYPNAIVIGLTATPFRQDNRGLGEIYERLVVCATPSQLVADGFIVRPRCFGAPQMPDLTDVKITAGEYNGAALERAMTRGKLVGNIVAEWLARAEGRRTVVFAASVTHSKAIVQNFIDEGVAAAHIDASTPGDQRALTLHKLNTGELSVVSNVDVLCEGWDQPSVKCAVLARPTQSLRVHLQQVGRILRPFDGPGALILDHAGNMRHGPAELDRVYDLEMGQGKKPDVVLHTCKSCFAIWAGSGACPECGVELPNAPRELPEVAGDVRLVEVSRETLTPERAYFNKLADEARDKGWKPGAASARYKEKFGAWPPWAWSQALKAMFAADAQWQEDVEKATERRAYWQNKKKPVLETPTYDD